MKIATFRAPSGTMTVGNESLEKYCDDYVRTSEYIEVEFPPIPDAERTAQLARLEAAREKARRYYEHSLKEIDKQAQELRL